MDNSISFSRSTALGQALLVWWQGLDNNRGERAELRRASNLTEIVLSPAFQRLYRRLIDVGLPEKLSSSEQDRLAAIAAVMAHVNEASEKRLPEDMRQGDEQKVSELRFRRLLESPSIDDLVTGLRRTLPLLGKRADPNRLANDIWFWGDKVRKDWAYSYPWPKKST